MSFSCFTTLCNMLKTNYGLQLTLNISIEESVAMFLRICGHNEHAIILELQQRQDLFRILKILLVDQRYWSYFSGFVGAMDGTHVCVKVKHELQRMYWNRHDNASLNIMAICDLNMLFT
ncbi:hypothetical protein AtEden1_Chr5g0119381 [Arabidopsis thaliana]